MKSGCVLFLFLLGERRRVLLWMAEINFGCSDLRGLKLFLYLIVHLYLELM